MCDSIFAIFTYWWNESCVERFGTYGFSWIFEWKKYPLYFLFTLLLEAPIYFLFLRKRFSLGKVALISLILNLCTHPLVYLVFPTLADRQGITYGWYVAGAEGFAWLVESVLLQVGFRIPRMKAFGIALAANLFSWLVGGKLADILQSFMR